MLEGSSTWAPHWSNQQIKTVVVLWHKTRHTNQEAGHRLWKQEAHPQIHVRLSNSNGPPDLFPVGRLSKLAVFIRWWRILVWFVQKATCCPIGWITLWWRGGMLFDRSLSFFVILSGALYQVSQWSIVCSPIHTPVPYSVHCPF